MNWLRKDKVIPLHKYQYLEQKYNDLVAEFKAYRILAERDKRKDRKEIKYLSERDKIHQDIFLAVLPHMDLPRHVKNKVDELNDKATDLIKG